MKVIVPRSESGWGNRGPALVPAQMEAFHNLPAPAVNNLICQDDLSLQMTCGFHGSPKSCSQMARHGYSVIERIANGFKRVAPQTSPMWIEHCKEKWHPKTPSTRCHWCDKSPRGHTA